MSPHEGSDAQRVVAESALHVTMTVLSVDEQAAAHLAEALQRALTNMGSSLLNADAARQVSCAVPVIAAPGIACEDAAGS